MVVVVPVYRRRDGSGHLIGKTLAPKGASDASAQSEVREDQLHPYTRIVRSPNAMKVTVSNPNRQTFIWTRTIEC
jgi:hypothetical protein